MRAHDLPRNLTVDVYFHLSGMKERENPIVDKIANTQRNVLYSSFAKYDIYIRLKSTTRVVDDLAGRAFLCHERTGAWVG
jgi:hypothetical protein